MEDVKCSKCGEILEVATLAYKDHVCPPDDIELQLLFVVMGEQTVCKVEINKTQFVSLPTLPHVSLRKGMELTSARFPDIRAVIDAMEGEGEKPVPRIEKREFDHYLIWNKAGNECHLEGEGVIHALSQIAGHPLEVYEPKPRGEWTQLYPIENGQEFLSLFDTAMQRERVIDLINERLSVKIYRYTRRAE